MEQVSKFVRGQVWYRKDDSDENKNTRVQKGDRPVLIFSSDDGNRTSDIVSVIPLTLERKPKIPINVKFMNDKGLIQTALCNQLCPVDKTDLVEYRYMVSEDIMKSIEKGVMIANGMKSYIMNQDIQCTYDNLKEIIEGIVRVRVNEILESGGTRIVTAEDLHSIVDSLVKGGVVTDVKVADENKNKVECIKKAPVKKSRKQVDWGLKECKQFCEDKESMSLQDVMKKYALETKKKVDNKYYYCKKRLSSSNA